MKPTDACFDGEKGIFLIPPGDQYPCGLTFKILRGKKSPRNYPDKDFRNQLAWVSREGKESELLFCNNEGKWFRIDFSEISEEFWDSWDS